MVIPKFKVLDFDKYKGTTRPKNHLKTYCRKIGAYAKDEELLITHANKFYYLMRYTIYNIYSGCDYYGNVSKDYFTSPSLPSDLEEVEKSKINGVAANAMKKSLCN